jgi:hypothetical protein
MLAMLTMFASDQPPHFRTYSPKGQGRSTSWHCKTHADSTIAILLLASVAARDAWLLLWTSRPFLEQVRALTDALSFA